MRSVKILLAAFVALFCVFYAAQNIVNLQAGHGFVAYVASMADHTSYPDHFGPPVTVPAITWLMYFTIIALELSAGLFAAKGAYDMFAARSGSAEAFNAAKQNALIGCGIAILVWFGIFGAFAGAYFQAWQTDAGGNAVREAALFSIQHGIVLLVLANKDD